MYFRFELISAEDVSSGIMSKAVCTIRSNSSFTNGCSYTSKIFMRLFLATDHSFSIELKLQLWGTFLRGSNS